MFNYILIKYAYKSIISDKKKLHVIFKCVKTYMPEISYSINFPFSSLHFVNQNIKLSLCLIIKHYSMKTCGGVEI
jgi:hypothetical protein